MKPAQILLVEDDSAIAESLRRLLDSEGYSVSLESKGDKGLERARGGSFDVIITDLRLPGLSGLELVRLLHESQPRVPILLMTAHGTTETAIEAIKHGAYDYLLKPFEMEELLALLEKACSSRRLMNVPVEWPKPVANHDAIIGTARAMQALYKEIGRVAAKPVNVLIRGETGTGKELVARALYQHSHRAQSPFVAVNTAAIPETLLESELFGHERGAFTGAQSRRIGRFEQASGGTIFLDEIGDMSINTQAKLLRVIQEKCLERLGGTEIIPVDVRVLAATHRDLETAIQHKQFREDLYYRLSVVTIWLPPLRERREDIEQLAHYFLRKYSSELGVPMAALQPEALALLQGYSWPGNVREMENVVRKLLLQASGYPITSALAQLALNQHAAPPSSTDHSLASLAGELLAAQRGELEDAHARLLITAERELLGQAIVLAQGNQAKAARWLGISRLTLREKLSQFGLHPSQENSKT